MGKRDRTNAVDVGQDAFTDVGEEPIDGSVGKRDDNDQSIFDPDAIAKQAEEAEKGDDGAEGERDKVREDVTAPGRGRCRRTLAGDR